VTLGTILRLGRVSNLPTVWTNALAGAVLAGAPSPGSVLLAALALSLFYAGGMWLNDAFDAEVDARERPDRPIPMGEVGRDAVFAIGFALLIAAMLAALLLGNRAAGVAVALGAAIVLYDWLHKRMALSPVIMGTARFLAYGLGAAAVGPFAGPALLGALGLFTYVVGLTYAAKQEVYDRIDRIWPLGVLALPVLYALWQAMSAPLARFLWLAFAIVVLFALRFLIRRGKGDVPRGVVALIAGITLYDAVLIAAAGEPRLAILAAAGFALTLVLQRLAPGT
jgi:4-hydroxybenzoate polyprenyltransferase